MGDKLEPYAFRVISEEDSELYREVRQHIDIQCHPRVAHTLLKFLDQWCDRADEIERLRKQMAKCDKCRPYILPEGDCNGA